MPSHDDASRPSSQTVRRTRTGCLTCRARKVKCDESRPTCQNCTRCLRQCIWPQIGNAPTSMAPRMAHVSTSASGSGSSSTRRNIISACIECRAAKSKCSQERPSCARCRDLGKNCRYQPGSSPDGPASHGSSSEADIPTVSKDRPESPQSDHLNFDSIPNALVHRLIQAFFTHVYPCQANGFIHRGTLQRNFQAGQAGKKLLLAICAVAARFVSDAAVGQSQVDAWSREAKSLLILEDMSNDTVAAALILARHDVNSGNYSSAWLLSSIATRAALALGMNIETGTEDSTLSFIEKETRRRLFWACYCLDRMMATGLPESVILRSEHVHLRLPCEEQQYLLDIPCQTPIRNLEVEIFNGSRGPLRDQRDIGIFGHYVQIMQIRFSILKYVRNHPDCSKETPPWDPSSAFAQCVHKMTAWKQSLSPQFQLLPDTIFARQAQDQLSALIMLHVWYEQCMSDLYRIVIPGFPESLPGAMLSDAPAGWVQEHQFACLRHAINISSIFEKVAALVDMEQFVFLDSSLPICVYESLCVRLQGLFKLPSEFLIESKEQCKASFKTLLGYIERMSRYFRQAKWLLMEAHKALFRHGMPINGTSDSYLDESNTREPGNHPWQRRIQRLKNIKPANAENSSQQMHLLAADSTPFTTQVDARVNPHRPGHAATDLSNIDVHGHSLYPVPEGVGFEFDMNGQAPYPGSFIHPPNGWGEAQVVPGLASFLGVRGEWMAEGLMHPCPGPTSHETESPS